MFRYLHRSMFGQMLIIAVIFLGVGVYYFAIKPILSIQNTVGVAAIDVTHGEIGTTLSTFVIAERTSPGTGKPLDQDAFLKQVAAVNPNFRYFARVNGRDYGDRQSAVFYDRYQIERIERFNAELNQPAYCATMTNTPAERQAGGGFSYSGCGPQSYYEFSGVTAPVARPEEGSVRLYQKFIWPYSQTFLITSIVAFLIFAGILLFNFVRVGKVAQRARALDLDKLDQTLPEQGLPIEVLSLVRALNEMIRRADDVQQKRKFFLSAAAHEMRTPLTVLRTRLEIMEEGELKDKLIGDVRRLSNLVNQLLTLMSVGARGPLDVQVDLVACCHKVVAGRQPLADARQIDLGFDSQRASFVVVGDPGLIEVAISNLLDNAIVFSNDGGAVHVSLDDEGRLTVRDHGPGVDQAFMEAVFEPFFRISQSRGGHGLGLAIVKAIVLLHHGKIEVRNAEGGGAVFTVSFGQAVTPERAERLADHVDGADMARLTQEDPKP